ncbi:MAG: AMP-binding protein [Candidatus Moduliflexus flocculans]|nr:AMP-binding protein [Candidatus Moduliflexus flocculans]
MAYLGITAAGFTVVPDPDGLPPGPGGVHRGPLGGQGGGGLGKAGPQAGPVFRHLVPVESLAGPEARKAAAAADLSAAFLPLEPEALAAIIYTSGTTGNSKGVMLIAPQPGLRRPGHPDHHPPAPHGPVSCPSCPWPTPTSARIGFLNGDPAGLRPCGTWTSRRSPRSCCRRSRRSGPPSC